MRATVSQLRCGLMKLQPQGIPRVQVLQPVPHPKFNPQRTQPRHPATQQGCRLHFPRIHAPGARRERLHPQAGGPFPQRRRAEHPEQPLPAQAAFLPLLRRRLAARPVTPPENNPLLGVRQIQASAPGDQKLPSHGRLRIEDGNLCPPVGGNFRRPQARRSTANHHDIKMLLTAECFLFRSRVHKERLARVNGSKSTAREAPCSTHAATHAKDAPPRTPCRAGCTSATPPPRRAPKTPPIHRSRFPRRASR